MPKPDYKKVMPKVWTNNDYFHVIQDKKKLAAKIRNNPELEFFFRDDMQKDKRPLRLEALQHHEQNKNVKAILKAKKGKMIENSFTFSLGQVHDKQFVNLIMPSLQH